MAPTIAQIVDQIREVGLLDASQIAQVQRKIKTQSPSDFVRELVRHEFVTTYQANKIAAGKSNELLVGPYLLMERIGTGGMGEVFKARHTHLDRIVALKLIQKGYLANSVAVKRFYREAKAAAKLNHPNVIAVHDVGQSDDVHYLAMEYVEGVDLSKLVHQSGQLPIPQACEFIRQAALGLHHAHEKGLVHRDIKPSNLLVTRSEAEKSPTIKVLDFGLARFADNTVRTKLTKVGKMLGTVDYVSPEQAVDARKADARSDIYSLGCSLFFLLTGKPPFAGESRVERLSARLLGTLEPVRKTRPEVPVNLEQIIVRMVAPEPAHRFQNANEVAMALAPFAKVTKTDAAIVQPQAEQPKASECPKAASTASGFSIGAESVATGSFAKPTAKRSYARWFVGGAGVALVALFVLTVTLVMNSGDGDSGKPSQKVSQLNQKPKPKAGGKSAEPDVPLGKFPELPEPKPKEPQPKQVEPEPKPKPKVEPKPKEPVETKPKQKVEEPKPNEKTQPKVEATPKQVEENPKYITNSIGMKLAYIPPGKFMMGSPETEKHRGSEEGPQHEVHITTPFYIGVYEVTQARYQRVMGANPSYFSAGGGGKDAVTGMDTSNFPVEYVSWNDAVEFCKKLSDLPKERSTGRVYRLPSEAEWEYTCREGAASYQVFHFGNSLSSTQANFNGEHPYGGAAKGPNLGRTTNIGSYRPNAFGVYDMHGNVWEWCTDWYDAGYYGKSPLRDPLRLTKSSVRVMRGGCWAHDAVHCRAAHRRGGGPGHRSEFLGFRIVCTVEQPVASKPKTKVDKADNPATRNPDKYITNSIGMKLAYIPPGKFMTGSSKKEIERFKTDPASRDPNLGGWDRIEGPRHEVTISNPIYMGIHEVTQRQYEKIMGANPSRRKNAPDHPVTSVLYDEAVEFCRKLSELPEEKKAGKVYRLPTEAEWEYACRAGTTTAFHWGDSLSSKQANFVGTKPFGKADVGPNLGSTTPVGWYKPNAWGLYDMHGNVWEWCLDRPRRYASKAVENPKGDWGNGDIRITRGGSYLDAGVNCRSALRNLFNASQRGGNVGFRVVWTTKPEQTIAAKQKKKVDKVDNPATKKLPKFITNSIGMKLAYIPPGKFMMGSSKKEIERFKREPQRGKFPGWEKMEAPQHEVTISRGFLMGVYEVTQRQYQLVMGSNTSRSTKSPEHPVEWMTHAEALTFCKRLSALGSERNAGRAYRLPTEAEWEYACRAGTTTAFYYGDSLSSKQANCRGNIVFGDAEKGPFIGKTMPVGSYKPNAWGLYDMHGNVWEWCIDGPRVYNSDLQKDPVGPLNDNKCVERGGSWRDEPWVCRSALRGSLPRSQRTDNVGFRVVCIIK